MLGCGLAELRPRNLRMNKTGYRQFLSDLVYKWAPLGLVILLFIICTALASVSGRLSHAEFVGFCVTALLLVILFAMSHCILRYIVDQNQVDLEKNQES